MKNCTSRSVSSFSSCTRGKIYVLKSSADIIGFIHIIVRAAQNLTLGILSYTPFQSTGMNLFLKSLALMYLITASNV